MKAKALSHSNSVIIIQVYRKMPCGKCSKTQNARGAREIAFAAIFISQLICECFTEKKNRHFNHHTAYYYSREDKSRWYAAAIRIDYVGRPVVECRRPKCLAT